MYFGTQYYRTPHPSPECWRKDMANIKSLGFNTVKLWAVWNSIELQNGHFNYSVLDELIDIAAGEELKVIINIIPEGAPYWLETGNEDALYTTSKGEKVFFSGAENIPTAGWPGLCMDKPEVARLVCRFIENITMHYRNNPTVEVFDVWNEPHLEPMFAYRNDILCYCKNSLNEFRKWLKEKYGDLGTLNEKWYRCYTDWDQVRPPVRMSTWTDMMDWRLFWLNNLSRWLRLRVQAAKKGAPEKLVQTHVAFSGVVGNKISGGLSNEVVDEFQLAPEVDIFGTSAFPKWLMGQFHVRNHLMQTEIIAEAAREKPFYQVELQGGAGKSGFLGTEVPVTRDINLWNWNTIAAGGKGVVYWQYSPEPAGLESPGFGLTGLQGENTERSIAAGECAKKMSDPNFDSATRILPVNGIYISRTSEVLCYCDERREQLYAESIAGTYLAAYKSGIPVRFVHADYVDKLTKEGLSTLYMPLTISLSDHEIQELIKFVKYGGTLVSEAFPGLYDEGGHLETRSCALKELFGLNHVEIENLPENGNVHIYRNNGKTVYLGRHYRHVVKPDDGVNTIGYFEDNLPAITEKRIGKGKAVWIGSFVSGCYYESGFETDGELITSHMQPNGYDIIDSISFAGTNINGDYKPVIRLLENDNKLILVVVNHLLTNAVIHIDFKQPQKINNSRRLTIEVPKSDGCYYIWDK